jgi:hypothetical protein
MYTYEMKLKEKKNIASAYTQHFHNKYTHTHSVVLANAYAHMFIIRQKKEKYTQEAATTTTTKKFKAYLVEIKLKFHNNLIISLLSLV